MVNKKKTITVCPKCEEYLGMHYKYCMYCGIDLKNVELLVVELETRKIIEQVYEKKEEQLSLF